MTSPNDEVYDLEEKVEEYLRAGVRLIWVIHPEVQVIEVIRADGSGLRIRPGGELSGEDVVPGFRCPVASVFPAARPADAAETANQPPRHDRARSGPRGRFTDATLDRTPPTATSPGRPSGGPRRVPRRFLGRARGRRPAAARPRSPPGGSSCGHSTRATSRTGSRKGPSPSIRTPRRRSHLPDPHAGQALARWSLLHLLEGRRQPPEGRGRHLGVRQRRRGDRSADLRPHRASPRGPMTGNPSSSRSTSRTTCGRPGASPETARGGSSCPSPTACWCSTPLPTGPGWRRGPSAATPKHRGRLSLIHPDGTGIRHLTEGSANEGRLLVFRFSPDGREIAHVEVRVGERRPHVAAVPRGPRRQEPPRAAGRLRSGRHRRPRVVARRVTASAGTAAPGRPRSPWSTATARTSAGSRCPPGPGSSRSAVGAGEASLSRVMRGRADRSGALAFSHASSSSIP